MICFKSALQIYVINHKLTTFASKKLISQPYIWLKSEISLSLYPILIHCYTLPQTDAQVYFSLDCYVVHANDMGSYYHQRPARGRQCFV